MIVLQEPSLSISEDLLLWQHHPLFFGGENFQCLLILLELLPNDFLEGDVSRYPAVDELVLFPH